MILRDMDNMLATYGTVDLSVKGCGGVAMYSSQRICYPLLVSRGFQIPISDTADCKSAVTVISRNRILLTVGSNIMDGGVYTNGIQALISVYFPLL